MQTRRVCEGIHVRSRFLSWRLGAGKRIEAVSSKPTTDGAEIQSRLNRVNSEDDAKWKEEQGRVPRRSLKTRQRDDDVPKFGAALSRANRMHAGRRTYGRAPYKCRPGEEFPSLALWQPVAAAAPPMQ